jgi:hypothetical protein
MNAPTDAEVHDLATTLASVDLLDMLTPAGVAEARAHPRFREVLLVAAQGGIAHYLASDAERRWIMRDLGRMSIALTAIILQAYQGAVTAQTLIAQALTNETSSRGRVLDFLRRTQAAGLIQVPPGEAVWTQRPLVLQPAFSEVLRTRALVEVGAAGMLFPEIGSPSSVIGDDGSLRRFLSWLAVLTTVRRPFIRIAADDPLALFLHREVGMLILYDVMLGQPPGRARLLEAATFSRNALSQKFGVSRVHVNRLFSDVAALGHLSFTASDRVVFAPQLSEALEFRVAVNMQMTRASALASMDRTASAA